MIQWHREKLYRDLNSLPNIHARQKHTMRSIAKEYNDCTAEVATAMVMGREKVEVSHKLSIGCRATLKLRDGDVWLVAGDGMPLGKLYYDGDTLLPKALAETRVNAFVGGRDMSVFSERVDALAILAFYRLPGVGPTKVNVESIEYK